MGYKNEVTIVFDLQMKEEKDLCRDSVLLWDYFFELNFIELRIEQERRDNILVL